MAYMCVQSKAKTKHYITSPKKQKIVSRVNTVQVSPEAPKEMIETHFSMIPLLNVEGFWFALFGLLIGIGFATGRFESLCQRLI